MQYLTGLMRILLTPCHLDSTISDTTILEMMT